MCVCVCVYVCVCVCACVHACVHVCGWNELEVCTMLAYPHISLFHTMPLLLGNSGRVVNSLDFCSALLKSLGCFYFRCVLSSQWKAVTENLQILHCQL